MQLLKTCAIPAGMHARQAWAAPFLLKGKEMDNPQQKWVLTVLKKILMVKDTTPLWRVQCMSHARVWSRAPAVQLVPGSSGYTML